MKTFNEFFDCLNGKHSSQHLKDKKPNLAPYRSPGDERFSKLKEVLVYLDNWKKEVESVTTKKEERAAMMLSAQTRVGIEMTIRGFIGVTKYLLEPVANGGAGTRFIMAGVFSQDVLEIYFSKQRAACGANRNPNERQYLQNVASLHLQRNLRMKRPNANVLDCHAAADIIDEEPLPKRKKTARRSLLLEGSSGPSESISDPEEEPAENICDFLSIE